MNVLFVCSRNEWRSPTAETIYRNHPTIFAKSAGTSSSARIKINQKHIDWAEVIFVMEKKHLQLIEQKFGNHFRQKIIVLNIEDVYQYMDEELIDELKTKVAAYL
ncbi:protein tyrosine phosphatase [Pedobacter sp.]|uniref:low molecular weight protein tyrosine phosphatase family protein n=1 Tax=Pedobacter sp. TaxID=1411316 RepID=UPI0031D186C1